MTRLKNYSIYLDEENIQQDFLPLTLTRSVSDLRIGIFSIKERWQFLAQNQSISLKFSQKKDADFSIAANLIPKANVNLEVLFNSKSIQDQAFCLLNRLWELVQLNIVFLKEDLQLLDTSSFLPSLPKVIALTGEYPVLIDPTAKIDHCFINTENGAVVIDKQAQIMAGAMLRGPIYIGENSVVKMGATLYEGTNIGKNCVVGGEIKNSILHANSNKSHHGYLGDSYIGEWCNLGAGTTCSNLKNTAGKIKIWDMHSKAFRIANEKAGVFMGDYVKTAVNTTINSGSVFGAFTNVFANETLSPKYIPPFSWGDKGKIKYDIEKLMGELEKWMAMKGQSPSELLKENINKLYNQY